ncbi:hypothetical protein FJR11_21800 [Anabaena sp. UHCC 0187]|nr:hypothetical protein [Anabaena sp. UHCC 0187]MTJ46995.1 hypothetical protein [Dolichospermum sp. UHCC 0259]
MSSQDKFQKAIYCLPQIDILDNQPDNSENLTAITVMAGLVEKMMGYMARLWSGSRTISL